MVKRAIKERRRYPRAKRVISVQHVLYKRNGKKAGGENCLSATQDMSVEGLLFVSDLPYRKKDIIELQVRMCGMLDIFNGHGEVVRVTQKSPTSAYMVAVALKSTPKRKQKKVSTVRKELKSKKK